MSKVGSGHSSNSLTEDNISEIEQIYNLKESYESIAENIHESDYGNALRSFEKLADLEPTDHDIKTEEDYLTELNDLAIVALPLLGGDKYD